MNIRTLASSSSGCCYIIESEDEQVMIECGIPLKVIRPMMDHDLSKIKACLVSHEHGDHASGIPILHNKTSIKIYCTPGTKKRYKLTLARPLSNKHLIKVGKRFSVLCLKMQHDVECYGFVITDLKNMESVLYASDTVKVPYTVQGLKKVLIECNHSYKNLIDSEGDKTVAGRSCNNHLDLKEVLSFVRRHKDLDEIHLIHLSAAHGDPELFRNEVMGISGAAVYIAGE